MKRETANKLNALVWLAIAIALMWMVYTAWSSHGPYTMGSFCASLLFHGAPCFLGWLWTGEAIERHYSNKTRKQ